MPRLFSGLAIPERIVERLALYSGGLPGARWVDPSDLHLTLRFFGDVDNPTADDLHEGMVAMRPREPIAITLAGLACFGGDKPRAIYAAVAPNPDLADLQDEHERIARGAGLEPERRRFTPHVTLARLNRSVKADALAHVLAQAGLFPKLDFVAESVALFSARESRGGGPYVVEAIYPLGERKA